MNVYSCGTNVADMKFIRISEWATPLLVSPSYNGIFINSVSFKIYIQNGKGELLLTVNAQQIGNNYVAKTRINSDDSLAAISNNPGDSCIPQIKIKLN